jgi:hypothetical protein
MVLICLLRNRIEMGFQRKHRRAATVSGAVCRRFESCQARYLPTSVRVDVEKSLGPKLALGMQTGIIEYTDVTRRRHAR